MNPPETPPVSPVAPPPAPSGSDTIRASLSDAVNELNKLVGCTTDRVALGRLRALRRDYFALWEQVIRQELDKTTPLYAEAIVALRAAEAAAKQAQQSLDRLAGAMELAAHAAQAVDKIVRLGIDMVA